MVYLICIAPSVKHLAAVRQLWTHACPPSTFVPPTMHFCGQSPVEVSHCLLALRFFAAAVSGKSHFIFMSTQN